MAQIRARGARGVSAAIVGTMLLVLGCQAEQRPTPGSVKTIGGAGTESVSASGPASPSQSVSGAAASQSGSVSQSVSAATGPASSPSATFAPSTPAGGTERRSFDTDSPDGLPADARVLAGNWLVRPEADAPSQPHALCQTGEAEYPALALVDAAYGDVELAVRFKPISGQVDQAAGFLFRAQDPDNYYILRANALENNVNLYKYEGGRRSGLKDGSATVPSGQWQELRLEVRGDTFRGFLDGQQVVEASDSTFSNAGRVGLWTKADSVTCFDDFEARPL